jgi:hypothetical protein
MGLGVNACFGGGSSGIAADGSCSYPRYVCMQ